jgi:hypothetical protein
MSKPPNAEPDLQAMFESMSIVIGQANTAWARVENAMAGFLEKLIGHSEDYVALHIYFAPNNTETRFKIVDTLARVKIEKHKPPHDLLDEWAAVSTALGRAKEVRNRIAHGEIHTPSRTIKGKVKWQARLTASSFDIGRSWKEQKLRQWPGMSVHDVKATADRFFWLAVRVEEIARYWEAYSLQWKQPPLPEIFARIVEHRQKTDPPPSGQTPLKPKGQPRASRK